MWRALAALPEVWITQYDSASAALAHREGAEVGMTCAGLVNQEAKSARDRREEQNAAVQNISFRQYGRKP